MTPAQTFVVAHDIHLVPYDPLAVPMRIVIDGSEVGEADFVAACEGEGLDCFEEAVRVAP